jgi:uncharacterized protein
MIPKEEREAAYRRLAIAFGLVTPDAAADAEVVVSSKEAAASAAATSVAEPEQAPAPRAARPLPTVCYAARPNSLAIRANGKVQKCTVLMHDERNHLGDLSENGTMKLDRDKMAYWMRGYDSARCRRVEMPRQRRATSCHHPKNHTDLRGRLSDRLPISRKSQPCLCTSPCRATALPPTIWRKTIC